MPWSSPPGCCSVFAATARLSSRRMCARRNFCGRANALCRCRATSLQETSHPLCRGLRRRMRRRGHQAKQVAVRSGGQQTRLMSLLSRTCPYQRYSSPDPCCVRSVGTTALRLQLCGKSSPGKRNTFVFCCNPVFISLPQLTDATPSTWMQFTAGAEEFMYTAICLAKHVREMLPSERHVEPMLQWSGTPCRCDC
jgi:hypothetical protein